MLSVGVERFFRKTFNEYLRCHPDEVWPAGAIAHHIIRLADRGADGLSQKRENWPFVENFVANFVDGDWNTWDFDKVSDEVSDKVFPKTLLGQALAN
jgi:hypothetical protein